MTWQLRLNNRERETEENDMGKIETESEKSLRIGHSQRLRMKAKTEEQ